MQTGRRSRGRTAARKVKSREIVDDAASDDSNRDKDDTLEAAAADGKRKRQSHKSRRDNAPKDSKRHRKRQTKNKVRRCTSL